MSLNRPVPSGPVRILVIGGSGSLGGAVCRELASSGAKLAFTFHTGETTARELAGQLAGSGVDVRCFRMDLTELAQVNRTIQEAAGWLGGLDALAIVSGISTGQPWTGHQPDFFEITPAGFDRMQMVNVRGVFFACQAAARIMRAGNGGRIVITGSIDGCKPVPSPPDYASCKAALWGLTRSLAKELGPYSILVNMVAPGILEGGIANSLDSRLREDYLRHCALRRVGTFDEVARVAGFLAGPANTYLTGQAVILDGGL